MRKSRLGLVLAFGSLWVKLLQDRENSELPAFAEAMAEAINAWLEGNHGKAKDHRLVFARTKVTNPFNVVTNMDTPRAVQFRYMWLQVLGSGEAWASLDSWITDRDDLDTLVAEARVDYLNYAKEVQAAALKTVRPDLSEAERSEAAFDQASQALSKALSGWFAFSDEDYVAWLESLEQEESNGPSQPEDDDGEEDDVDLDGSEGALDDGLSLSDFIGDESGGPPEEDDEL